MPSSSSAAARASAETALLEKIEELSFLRSLTDRLARVPDFGSACRALVDVVWEERAAETVAYLSVDAPRGVCRLEAAAPAHAADAARTTFPLDAAPFPALLAAPDGLVLAAPAALPWLTPGGLVVAVPTRVRDATTGLLVFQTRAAGAALDEDRRLLAMIATSAALALDVARNEAREEFLAMLRHDINNPVHAALGYTAMIVDRLQAEGQTELLALTASVTESLEVIADLVSNYLDMTAIDRGAPGLHHATLDLGALAGDVVERLRPSASEKRIVLAFGGRCPPLAADVRQLGRVVMNLVTNAIKYTPRDGRVDVVVSGDAARGRLVVRDTGYGLAPDDLRRLGTKYVRFHRDLGIPGTGLGLYLSKAIVEAHGGTLTATSSPGQGSTFTVELPRRAG